MASGNQARNPLPATGAVDPSVSLAELWTTRLGVAGAYLFAFFSLLGITPATAGLALATLAFFFRFRRWAVLWREPVVRMGVVFALYVAVHSMILSSLLDEESAAVLRRTGLDWVKLLLFLPVAYWAGATPRRAGQLLFLALVGFAIGFLRKIDWAAFGPSFFYTRFESYLPAIAFGMFCGLGVIGLIAARLCFWTDRCGSVSRWVAIPVWAALLVLMVEGLFLSFSRGSWLAFTVALLTLMILEWRARQHQREQSVVEPFVLGSTLLAAIALVVLFGTQLGAVTERVLTEAHTTLQVLRGDWSGVESDSVGLRIHALRFAADLWTQRPWLGWGAGSAGELIATSGRPELLEAPGHWLAHLHNTYAELLVQFGLFGSSLLVAMIWLLGRAAFQECRVASDRATLCRYLFVAFVFALIWSLFSYRMTRHDGLFFWILFAGAAYSLRLRRLFWTAQA